MSDHPQNPFTEWQVEGRRLGHACSHLATPQPFSFLGADKCPPEQKFHTTDEHADKTGPSHWASYHRPQQTKIHGPPQSICPHLTTDLRVTVACCPQPPLYHHGLIDQRAPGMHTTASIIGKQKGI